MLMISSCSALLLVCLLALGPRKVNLQSRLPFGPFLGLGLIVCWLTALVT
jgi:prepilin signal peptidase PulO-like enzyme (type II secretory pathway)